MRVDTSGLDEIIEQMAQMGQLSGEAARAMLRSGANEVQREMIMAIKRGQHVATGDMVEGVGQTNARERGTALQVEIYPQGRGSSGVKNATKLFILHHGRSGKREIKATNIVDTVMKKGTPRAERTMANVWERFMKTGRVPDVKKLKKGQE